MRVPLNRYVRKTLIILAWLFAILLVLIGLAFLLVEAPFVHRIVKNKVVTYLEEKLDTEVSIGKLSLDFPKRLVLHDVYLEDQQQDTLLAGDTLRVDLNFWKLLNKEVLIREVDLRGITAYIDRTLPDSTYNFRFIVDAFMREEEKDAPPPDSSATLKFSVHKINLDRVRLKINDEVRGNNLVAYLSDFETNIDKFDYRQRKFRIPHIKLSGLTASLHQTKPIPPKAEVVDTTDMPHPFTYPDIEFNEIDISDIHLSYNNEIEAIDSKLDLDSLLVRVNELDMQNQEADLQLIRLSNTSGSFILGERAEETVKSTTREVATALEKGWNIKLEKLDLNEIGFSYKNRNTKQLQYGLDYDHLGITHLNTDVEDIRYSSEVISAKVNELTVRESSGLHIEQFKTDLYYGPEQAYLRNLYLETPNSVMRDHIELHYPSADTIMKAPGLVTIDASFQNNRIAFEDLLLIVPTLRTKSPFRQNPDAVLFVDGDLSGRLDDLYLSDFRFSGLGNIQLHASGNIRGLPEVEDAFYDLRISNLTANRSDIFTLVPASRMPDNIQLPERMHVTGRFKGTFESFTANLDLNSSYGTASLDGTLRNIRSKSGASYDALIVADNFEIGKLIRKEDMVGQGSFALQVKGKGFNPQSADATIKGHVDQIFYKNYNYQNFKIDAVANSGDFEIDAIIADPNIAAEITGQYNKNGTYPQARFTAHIDTFNLLPLHLYDKDLRFSGSIYGDLETADPDFLNGTISLSDATIRLEENRYRLDTVSIVSVASEAGDTLDLRSEFLTVHMEGQYQLTKLWPAIQNTISQYFDITPNRDSIIAYPPQEVKLSAVLTHSPLIEELFPELEEMEDARLEAEFNSASDDIVLTGNLPRFLYKGFTVSELNMDVKTENDALNYTIAFDRLSRKNLQISNTSLTGKAEDDILEVNFISKDADDQEEYKIAGELTSQNGMFEYSLNSDGLILNSEPWNVSPDNAIVFGKEGLMFRDFTISNSAQSLNAVSQPQQPDAPIQIEVNDFRIETLTQLISKDSLLVGGIINGDANLRGFKTNLVFTSNLTIQDFRLYGDTVGHVEIHVDNEIADTYTARASLTGYGNEVNIDGRYFAGANENRYDLDVDIARIHMKNVEGFTMGEIDDASGTMTGQLKITGSSKTPDINGELRLHDVRLKVMRFNSYYRFPDERLAINDEGIVFNNFTVLDSAGNEAFLDGIVYTSDFKEYRLDLELRADNFQVLNSTRDHNKLYYGDLFIDTRMSIKGTPDAPVVDGTLRVKDNTNLTIVVPQSNPGIIEREGIVEFIDTDTIEMTVALPQFPDTSRRTDFTSLNLSVNIFIDRTAVFNIIIDEANGDYLRVRGLAELTGGIDPSGKVSLTGRYELDQGAYSFNFNQIKREFEIQKGSSITWRGDPFTADVDLVAVYTADVAPLSLVENQLAEADQRVINMYKQKLPFQILLRMNGELLRPNIAFEIELPERNYGVAPEVVSTVNARLAELETQQSELNKQVFAVLIFNRFISDDPFQSSGREGGISSLARQSASRLLSEQLNNVLGGMIAGFDLTFDLNTIEDYTTGDLQNRTELTVGVTRRLLDDRLEVTVGSNFELEGPQETDRETTNIAGDVSVEYQLTKDGRLLVRAYRKNEYIVVQGQVVESGIGFVFTADYDQFKDLFAKRTKEEKEMRKVERQESKQSDE